MHVQVAATLQDPDPEDPQADPKPGGDVDAVQWKEVASLSAMQSTLFNFLIASHCVICQTLLHILCFTAFSCCGVRASLADSPCGCHDNNQVQCRFDPKLSQDLHGGSSALCQGSDIDVTGSTQHCQQDVGGVHTVTQSTASMACVQSLLRQCWQKCCPSH